MSEKLKSGAPLGLGNWGSYLGLTTVRDEHGNSTRGTVLQCAGGERHRLTFEQWNDLHFAMGLPATAGFLSLQFDGDMPLLFGQESPLERGCQALNARQNRQSASNSRR